VDDRAVKGIPWTMLSYGANRVVSVATTILLARLLVPADFGLYALAMLGTGLTSQFSGLGLGNALILRQDLDRRGQGTILTLLLVTGIGFAVLLAAASPLLADLFREPRLTDVLLVMAGILSFTGVNWFYDSLLQRELAFKARFVSNFVSTLAFSIVALVLAFADQGVWALIGAHVAMHASRGIALLILTPYRVRPTWNGTLAREALRAGGGFVLQDGATYLQQNADYIVVGRVLPTAQLGFYSMAYRQAELPHYAIADPVARVTFPSFAAMRHRGEDVMPTFLSGLRFVALATCPIAVVLSAASEPFTRALFGEKWLPMIGVLAVLGIWAVVRPLEVTIAWLLNSLGEAGRVGRISAALLIPFFAGLYVAAEFGGITAVAWVLLAHMAVGYVLLSFAIDRVTGVSVATQWRALQPLVLASAIAWIATRATADALDGIAPLLALVVASLVAFLVYLVGVRVFTPKLLTQAFSQIRRALSRSAPQAPATSSA